MEKYEEDRLMDLALEIYKFAFNIKQTREEDERLRAQKIGNITYAFTAPPNQDLSKEKKHGVK